MDGVTQAKENRGLRILVVDDEMRIRSACEAFLKGEGFAVATAEDGSTGLKSLEKAHFDILLLDLMMPGIGGMEVLAQVRARHPDTLVVVITGYATLDHAVAAMKGGAFDFLAKPFAPQDLRSVIGKAIQHIRTLQDIAHEKSRVRVLINQLADGVLATDSQRRVALVNPAFLKMVGYAGPSPVGEDTESFLRVPKIRGMIQEALASPGPGLVEFTEELGREDMGALEEIVIEARSAPFRDRVGRILGSLTVLHDITALKKMDQMKSAFVAMVSHEIQGPMNSVLAQIKILRDGLAGPLTEKQEEILTRVTERVTGLSALARDLLDLARIEAGLTAQERECVDIRGILRDQVLFHGPRAGEKKISIALSEYGEPLQVLGNLRNLEEVFSNLLTNAIKYTEEGGRISVEAGREKGTLWVAVRDTGFGIPPEAIEHIFERFYRVKDARTRWISGTGLGLAIVKSIVAAHNGTLRVESEVGKGSTFTVVFPEAHGAP